MRKLYNEFFYLPKHGKIREKVMYTRVVMTVVIVVMCLAAMSFTAYAYFSCNITSGSNIIKAATYDLDWKITVKASDEGEQDQISVFTEQDTVFINPEKLPQNYVVTITLGENCTATTGFCVMQVDYEDEATVRYHTVQIGKDVNAGENGRQEYTLYIQLNQAASITFSRHWGTSSCYADFQETADGAFYLADGETSETNPLVLGSPQSVTNLNQEQQAPNASPTQETTWEAPTDNTIE